MEAAVALEEGVGDVMSPWTTKQYLDKYSWKDEAGEPTEVWPDTAYRVVRHVLGALGYTDKDKEFQTLLSLVVQRKFIPGGRYLAQTGHLVHQTNNCFLYHCADSDRGWADVTWKAIMALTSGGGIGVVYSDVRPNGSPIRRKGGVATGPLSPARMVNEVARHVMAGGKRRSAIWGGLHWNHADIFDWIHSKDWSEDIMKAKAEDPEFPAPMDMTNISVILDDEFFEAFHGPEHDKHEWATRVYREATRNGVATGEPGFSIDVGRNAGEHLRNACTEITSRDDSDVCNLGSINLARVETREELGEIVKLATLFLLAGTVYSDVPHDQVRVTREKNRRLGLGLLGLHEWLLLRGYRYEMVPELREWLDVYAESGRHAKDWAHKHHLSIPVKTRAIAPTGTIGIIGETTTGIEPMFCLAYIRRFRDTNEKWNYTYVIDPTGHRLVQRHGMDPNDIEDAYKLSYNVERRIKFQAEVQEYVDHGISATVNLPYPITEEQEADDFAETLIKYLPKLRGITFYPDGARFWQPLTAVPYEDALGKEGQIFEGAAEYECKGGSCGA